METSGTVLACSGIALPLTKYSMITLCHEVTQYIRIISATGVQGFCSAGIPFRIYSTKTSKGEGRLFENKPHSFPVTSNSMSRKHQPITWSQNKPLGFPQQTTPWTQPVVTSTQHFTYNKEGLHPCHFSWTPLSNISRDCFLTTHVLKNLILFRGSV